MHRLSLPFTDELEDRNCLTALGQNEDIWAEQVIGAAWLQGAQLPE